MVSRRMPLKTSIMRAHSKLYSKSQFKDQLKKNCNLVLIFWRFRMCASSAVSSPHLWSHLCHGHAQLPLVASQSTAGTLFRNQVTLNHPLYRWKHYIALLYRWKSRTICRAAGGIIKASSSRSLSWGKLPFPTSTRWEKSSQSICHKICQECDTSPKPQLYSTA